MTEDKSSAESDKDQLPNDSVLAMAATLNGLLACMLDLNQRLGLLEVQAGRFPSEPSGRPIG
ncbi:MAG: hypothetical protein EOP84_31085 [Verrucomicrobiaceae bacterium]|nr:MAG: hypothetical protein EOP84_31085 [Verrucomicrobiaceae bacterium]